MKRAAGDWYGGRTVDQLAWQMIKYPLTAGMSLNEALRHTRSVNFGATDCALPMLCALEKGFGVDIFVVLTGNKTWAGQVHPAAALRAYRRRTGIPAKLIVAVMTSPGFSIADPDDGGMPDVVGFDSAAPAVTADFARRCFPSPAQRWRGQAAVTRPAHVTWRVDGSSLITRLSEAATTSPVTTHVCATPGNPA